MYTVNIQVSQLVLPSLTVTTLILVIYLLILACSDNKTQVSGAQQKFGFCFRLNQPKSVPNLVQCLASTVTGVYPGKLKMITMRWFSVGSALNQHWVNISVYQVFHIKVMLGLPSSPGVRLLPSTITMSRRPTVGLRRAAEYVMWKTYITKWVKEWIVKVKVSEKI